MVWGVISRLAAKAGTQSGRLLAPKVAAQPLGRRFVHQTQYVKIMPAGFDMNSPTLKKIQGNPRAVAAMKVAVRVVQSKGFIDPAEQKPPSFVKLMQMMGDAEVKQALMKVQKVLNEEGIGFSPADLSAFTSGGSGMPQSSSDSKAAEGDKGGLFKRISESIKPRS